MGNHKRHTAEQLRAVSAQLEAAGVKEWTATKTGKGHVMLRFYRDGKPKQMVFSGSADPRASKNIHGILRGMLEGTR